MLYGSGSRPREMNSGGLVPVRDAKPIQVRERPPSPFSQGDFPSFA
jgi:hypothetical protein